MKRTHAPVFFALCAAALPVWSWAAEPLWINLGPSNEEHGLSVPSGGDGANAPETLSGSACRRITGSHALYLYIRAEAAKIAEGDHDAWLSLEYFDDRPQVAAVEYDLAPAVREKNTFYTRADDLILLTGNGQWQRAVIHLPHARFGHGQNSQADLRLTGHALAVRRIEIAFNQPADYRPGGFDSAKLEAFKTRIGPGMQLDLGCNATPAEAALYRMLGFTCVESYVTWQTVEDGGEGQWDWSRWDQQVEILRSAGLKWAPLLVCGPAYSLPKWFRDSNRSLPYVCLEHGERSKIQSLWDPAFRPWVDRFLAEFAQRYRDRGILELVRLGVTGIYGETLYPSGPSTGWIFTVPGLFHNHTGWWAGDPLAVESFRQAMRQQYGEIGALNRAWGTTHAAFDAVRPLLPQNQPSNRARLDFTHWYLASMTEFSAFWDATARKHFPNTPIYQSLGGAGEPILGADFTAQIQAAAPSGLCVRVTNEASDYSRNFAVTREVVTAARAFGLDFGTEPASHVSGPGNVARIYNATASGATHLFCYRGNILQDRESLALFREFAPQLQRREPVVQAALYLPKTSWELDEATHSRTLKAAQLLRSSLDFAMLDRTTLPTPFAQSLRLVAVAEAPFAEESEINALREWVAAGGILVARPTADGHLLRTPEGDNGPRDTLLRIPPASHRLLRPSIAGRPPRHFRLAIGQGDEPYLFGQWFGAEPGGMVSHDAGAKMRWTGAQAGCYLPCDPASDATLVLAANLLAKSLPGPNRVLVNGIDVGTLDQTGPRTFHFPVPKAALAGRPVAELALSIQPFPATAPDTRMLGIAIGTLELVASGAEQEPAALAPLTWEIDWAQAEPCVRRVGNGATLTLHEQNPAGLGALMTELLTHPAKLLPGTRGTPLPASLPEGVFATELRNGRLYYNSTSIPCKAGDVTVPAFGIAQQSPPQAQP